MLAIWERKSACCLESVAEGGASGGGRLEIVEESFVDVEKVLHRFPPTRDLE